MAIGYTECVELWLLYWSGPRRAHWRPIRPSIIKSLPTPGVKRNYVWLVFSQILPKIVLR